VNPPSALELVGVEKSFARAPGGSCAGSSAGSAASAPACAGVSLRVERGEFFTFLGPSGCGKTTLLRMVAGFLAPDKGVIRLDGQDAADIPAEKRGVGMVFQNYALFPHMTVRQNIEYGLVIRKRTKREIRETADRYLEMTGLAGLGDRKTAELSGGEQQRAALARALAVEPRILLLDEPLSNLDARLRDRMRGELKALQKRLGVTTVFVTHDQTEALTLSDRIAVFDKGRLVQTGPPHEIYDEPVNAFVAGFIGETNLFPARIEGGQAILKGGLALGLADPHARGEYVSIRPQSVEASREPLDGVNCFAGVMLEERVQGVFTGFSVAVGDLVIQAAALNAPGRRLDVRPGDAVHIRLPMGAVRALPA